MLPCLFGLFRPSLEVSKKKIKNFHQTENKIQPQRSDLTSDLKFMAQTTYATMFVWTVLAFFGQMIKKKKKENSSLLCIPLQQHVLLWGFVQQ